MKTLLTFTGYHDPFSIGLIEDEEQPGPILSLVAAEPFERVILIGTPNTEKNTKGTLQALAERHPDLDVIVREIPLSDPTDYIAILRELRAHLREICLADPEIDCAISVASGTPHMHACWMMLVASGEIPARILNIRPPRFVTSDKPLISEVDLADPEFPEMRTYLGMAGIADSQVASAPFEDVGEEMVAHELSATLRAPLSRPDDDADTTLETLDESAVDPHAVIRRLELVADHPAMQHAVEIAIQLAPSDASILILGETGTGKDLIARLIHQLSDHSTGRLVPVNCAAIPAELVESELFGHKRGAFTGAHKDKKGKFDLADGGTLFLDEVAELPLPMQAKLLRVLQDGRVEPVGDTKSHKVDVRIVAATNQELREAVDKKEFREDLYYRLAVGIIELPPLRERVTDIPKLALHILDRINATIRRPKRMTTEALKRLQAHAWRGNVRELQNVIERSVRLCRNDVLGADDLLITPGRSRKDPLSGLPVPHEGFSLDGFLSQARKQLMLRALELAGGNQSQAARLLGVTPQAVHRFRKGSE